MKVYGYDEQGFYSGWEEADESPLEPGVFLIPASSTTIQPPEHTSDGVPRFVDGEWVIVPVAQLPQSILAERAWRDSELRRADVELNKVQDGMGMGTVSAWRTYRCQLRDWPANPDFPDKGSRPVAPDTN